MVTNATGDRMQTIDPRVADPPLHLWEGDRIDDPGREAEVELLMRWKSQWWLSMAQIPQRELDAWIRAVKRGEASWLAQMMADRICRSMRWGGWASAKEFLRRSWWTLTVPAHRAALTASRAGEVGMHTALAIIGGLVLPH